MLSTLFITTLPLLGLSINEIKFNKVDFPEPDGPVIEYILPF